MEVLTYQHKETGDIVEFEWDLDTEPPPFIMKESNREVVQDIDLALEVDPKATREVNPKATVEIEIYHLIHKPQQKTQN